MKHLFTALVFISFSGLTLASSLENKLDALCENIKSCAMKSLEGTQFPPEMKSMMEAQFSMMCQPMRQKFNDAGMQGTMLKKAEACIESMNKLSCDQLTDGQNDTVECQDFQKYAEEHAEN